MSHPSKTDASLPQPPADPVEPAPVEPDPAKGGSSAFGVEGSNKTLPEPVADATPSDELEGVPGKYVPKSPHTAGSY